MAQTAGRCSTESEDGVACPGCTWCSRLYCIECRNRTGNVFSAVIGCRTFKRAECVRMVDESTDISQKKVPQTAATDRLQP